MTSLPETIDDVEQRRVQFMDQLSKIRNNQEPYAALGLNGSRRHDITLEDIKKQFRDMSRASHPDRNSEAGATEAQTSLNAAYNILIKFKPLYDAYYDEFEKTFESKALGVGETLLPVGAEPTKDMVDERERLERIRSELIQQYARKMVLEMPSEDEKRSALVVTVDLTLDQVDRGCTLEKLSVMRTTDCHDCKEQECSIVCDACQKTGFQFSYRKTGPDSHNIQKMASEKQYCRKCCGYVYLSDCKTCSGTQQVQEQHVLDVTVPPGMPFYTGKDAEELIIMGHGHTLRTSLRRGHIALRFRDKDWHDRNAKLVSSAIEALNIVDAKDDAEKAVSETKSATGAVAEAAAAATDDDSDRETKHKSDNNQDICVRLSRCQSIGDIFVSEVKGFVPTRRVVPTGYQDLTADITLSVSALIRNMRSKIEIKLPGGRTHLLEIKNLISMLTGAAPFVMREPQLGLPVYHRPSAHDDLKASGEQRGFLYIRAAFTALNSSDTDILDGMCDIMTKKQEADSKHV